MRKKGRGTPDVSGNAVNYKIVVHGKQIEVHGTSAVAPLWAGLIALINQELTARGDHRAGFLNPLIYGPLAGTAAFHDILDGNNDIDGKSKKYSAGPGWDACTGMGSPHGARLLSALSSAAKPKPTRPPRTTRKTARKT
jgi:kumamolisin